jgi:hypothetical protein
MKIGPLVAVDQSHPIDMNNNKYHHYQLQVHINVTNRTKQVAIHILKHTFPNKLLHLPDAYFLLAVASLMQ